MIEWIKIYSKCVKIIDSCKTIQQCETTKEYLKIAYKKIDKHDVRWDLENKMHCKISQIEKESKVF